MPTLDSEIKHSILKILQTKVLTFEQTKVLTFEQTKVFTFEKTKVLTFEQTHVLTFKQTKVLTFEQTKDKAHVRNKYSILSFTLHLLHGFKNPEQSANSKLCKIPKNKQAKI